MEKFLPLSVPNFKGNELEYVTNAIKTEWVSTAGSYIDDFEKKLALYLGVQDSVACQTGTAGLHLAMQVCGIKQNHEVIVPTLTFIAAINPVKYIGAEPIFIDCDDSLGIDPIKVEEFCKRECEYINKKLINIKTGREIKAIVVVHVFGNMADMEYLCDIAERYNLKIIEDATEALGSYYIKGRYKGKYAGTIGDVGVYSFNGNKIITTGGGGAIVSNNKDYLEKCKYLSTQAKDDTVYFIHNEVGYNYRMTNIQAALGLAQLEKLEEFIKIKRENYFLYKKLEIPLLEFRKNIRPNYWFYSYICNERDEIVKYLGGNNIQVRPIWKLIHTLKPYEKCQNYSIEKASYYYDNVVNIPCSTNLTLEDVEYVAQTIRFKG